MADVPSYEQWIRDTKAVGRKRSAHLVVLDNAIRAFGQSPSDTNREAIKVALDRWKFEKSGEGKDWRKSVRNKKGAVTGLYRAVNSVNRRNLTEEELEAMRFVMRAQAVALEKMFDGKTVTFKSSTLVGLARGAGANWKTFKAGAGTLASKGNVVRGVVKKGKSLKKGANLLQKGGRAAAGQAAGTQLQASIVDLCKTLCPGRDPNEIFSALGLPSVERFAMDLAPFVGALSSGASAVMAWIGVIKLQWARSNTADRRYAFAPGDPEAAFDAVLMLLDRELNAKLAKASVKTGAFTGKTLGAFLDAGAVTGPVVGLLEVLAEIMQTIIEYVRDLKEVDQANELIRLGALNFELFEICPILGCYFLVVQDHSTIINFAVGEYGTPNFVFDAERLVKKVDPVLARARDYIHASRFEIREFATAKGVVQQHWTMKGPLSRVGKGQVAPIGVRARNRANEVAGAVTDKIGELRGKKVKPPENRRTPQQLKDAIKGYRGVGGDAGMTGFGN